MNRFVTRNLNIKIKNNFRIERASIFKYFPEITGLILIYFFVDIRALYKDMTNSG